MKKIILLLFLAISGFFVSCHKGTGNNDVAIYSYTSPILNPPALFNIAYNITNYGDHVAEVTFEQNAVWKIEKLGDGRVNLSISNGTDIHSIISKDSLGLQANSVYYITVNNNNYTDFTNYFVGFTKLASDYDTFEPKF